MAEIKLEFKSIKSDASAHLYLGGHYGGNAKGRSYLTPQLVSESELDWWIDKLIDDLEKARKQGKRKFGDTKRK